MADTIRTYDALQNNTTGVYRDNTAGEISPQDLRDGIATLYGSRFVTSQSTTYSAVAGDEVILMDASGGVRDVDLPAVASSTHMSIVVVKTDSSTNAVTLDPNASETINGASGGLVLSQQYESVRIVCDGSEWFVIAHDHRPISEVFVHTGNGHGSTDTAIRRLTTKSTDTGAAITHATSAGNGDTFTINEAGLYAIDYCDIASAAAVIGITLNSAVLTTNIGTVTIAQGKLTLSTGSGSSVAAHCSTVLRLANTDVIRPHTNKISDDTTDNVIFHIVKIGN